MLPRRKDFTMYNYLIVGSGLYGAVMAQQLHAAGKKVLIMPEEAAAKIAEQRKEITGVPRNLEDKVIFGGRLGEYKYYDMDQVNAAALERMEGL